LVPSTVKLLHREKENSMGIKRVAGLVWNRLNPHWFFLFTVEELYAHVEESCACADKHCQKASRYQRVSELQKRVSEPEAWTRTFWGIPNGPVRPGFGDDGLFWACYIMF
jgi:hypothetical protein